MPTFDLILQNATLVDPVNRPAERADIAVTGGRIAEVGPELDPASSGECFDLNGFHILPGLIDLHVHVSSWLGGKYGHGMMAQSGVTTALDVSGPIDSVLEIARNHGVGLNLGCLQYIRPGHTVKDSDPKPRELRELLDSSLSKGAMGLKILGGHYPLSPEATAHAIEIVRNNNAFLTFHAGTLDTRSDIEGFHEAVQLSRGNPLTIAHINSYCRGGVRPYVTETEEAVAALEANPHICSESYLSPFNGTSAKCSRGVPESRVTLMCLQRGGFAQTRKGLEQAIQEGWAHINLESAGKVVLTTGQRAVDYWKSRQTDTTVSFPVNPDMPRLRLATAKRAGGEFAVDCLITDGGGIPRNVTVELGLALVKLGALTMEDFVVKTSRNPARVLGLQSKGHLAVGADADITVVDIEAQKPVMSLAGGKVIMFKGHVCGKGGRFITTPEGAAKVRENGLEPLVVDPAEAGFHRRSDR